MDIIHTRLKTLYAFKEQFPLPINFTMPEAQKIPVTPEQASAFQSLSITHTPCNVFVLEDGTSYNITGPERDEMIADCLKLDQETRLSKSLRRNGTA